MIRTRFAIAIAIAIAAAILMAGCASTKASPAAGGPTTPSSSPSGHSSFPQIAAAQAIAEHLSPRSSTVTKVNGSSGAVDVSYSFGGCQPAPTAVVIVQSSKSVTLVLVGPALPQGESACPPNLTLAKAVIFVPSLDGREVTTGETLGAENS